MKALLFICAFLGAIKNAYSEPACPNALLGSPDAATCSSLISAQGLKITTLISTVTNPGTTVTKTTSAKVQFVTVVSTSTRTIQVTKHQSSTTTTTTLNVSPTTTFTSLLTTSTTLTTSVVSQETDFVEEIITSTITITPAAADNQKRGHNTLPTSCSCFLTSITTKLVAAKPSTTTVTVAGNTSTKTSVTVTTITISNVQTTSVATITSGITTVIVSSTVILTSTETDVGYEVIATTTDATIYEQFTTTLATTRTCTLISSTNLIANPGFENGHVSDYTDWYLNVGGTTLNVLPDSSANPAHSGSYSLAMVVDEIYSGGGMGQNIRSCPGFTYDFEAYTRADSSIIGNNCWLTVQINTDNINGWNDVIAPVLYTDTNWFKVSGSFTSDSPSDGICVYPDSKTDPFVFILSVQLTCDQVGPVAYFDDFKLVPRLTGGNLVGLPYPESDFCPYL